LTVSAGRVMIIGMQFVAAIAGAVGIASRLVV
jgi:hypothetical protein